jgi:hypothetical protein
MIAKLARHPETGNISFWTEPQSALCPPMALTHTSPDPYTHQTQAYAETMLRETHVLAGNASPLVWTPCGYTISPDGTRTAAVAAMLPAHADTTPSPSPKGA